MKKMRHYGRCSAFALRRGADIISNIVAIRFARPDTEIDDRRSDAAHVAMLFRLHMADGASSGFFASVCDRVRTFGVPAIGV